MAFTVIASWYDVAAQHVLAFGLGVAFGFVLSNRYSIVKRNGKEDA